MTADSSVLGDLDFSAGGGFWTTQQDWSTIFGGAGTLIGWAATTTALVYSTTNTLRDVSSFGSFTITATTLTWSAVPEPTSALAGVLLGAGLLRRRRRA